jgi:hypothetical protein
LPEGWRAGSNAWDDELLMSAIPGMEGETLSEALLFNPPKTKQVLGNITQWTAQGGARSLADGALLGNIGTSAQPLFGSGTLADGEGYKYPFVASGLYRVADGAGHLGDINVPIRLDQVDLTKTLVWATQSVPGCPGCAYQVQRKFKPGRWQNLGTSTQCPTTPTTSATQEVFQAFQGPGTYLYRARLVNTATCAHADWSKTLSIVAT